MKYVAITYSLFVLVLCSLIFINVRLSWGRDIHQENIYLPIDTTLEKFYRNLLTSAIESIPGLILMTVDDPSTGTTTGFLFEDACTPFFENSGYQLSKDPLFSIVKVASSSTNTTGQYYKIKCK
jgi:hypothetical protein